MREERKERKERKDRKDQETAYAILLEYGVIKHRRLARMGMEPLDFAQEAYGRLWRRGLLSKEENLCVEVLQKAAKRILIDLIRRANTKRTRPEIVPSIDDEDWIVPELAAPPNLIDLHPVLTEMLSQFPKTKLAGRSWKTFFFDWIDAGSSEELARRYGVSCSTVDRAKRELYNFVKSYV